MQTMRLGRSGLVVPRISLGTNNFGGPQLNQEASNKIMARALELGIYMFDTADTYTDGESERIIGEFIKDRREDVIIATKVGYENYANRAAPPNKSGLSRKNIIYRLEQSLRKLQSSYVDLYYVHRYDPDVPIEETLTTLDSLVNQGKIRYIACSNYKKEQLEESRLVASKLGLENFVAIQNRYNLFDREIESSVIPYCSLNGIGTLAYSPLASGFLAAKYERGKPPPTGSRAAFRPASWLNKFNDGTEFQKLEKIKAVAAKFGMSVPILALAWTLREGKVTSAIVGASKPEQLDESVKAAETRLSNEAIEDLKLI